MTMNCDTRESRNTMFGRGILGVILAVILIGSSAWGQIPNNVPPEPTTLRQQDNPNLRVDSRPYQTFYLMNGTAQNDANEVVVAIRNLLDPSVKIYLVSSQNAITMRGTPEQLALAQKVINDLDRPKKSYRLTYTITEMDAGKRVGVQHFAMIVTAGQRTLIKQGSRVPIALGTNTDGNSVQYLDIGLVFDATLDQYGGGTRLRAKVEQSSVAEERSGVGPQDPVVRQTSLESTSLLLPGKPLVLGSLDIPSSTRHLDIDVMMEPIVP
jgi:type II secretory pathway component GspD/PulD (secretin)